MCIRDSIRALGSNGRKYVRERARGIKAAVSEIYSPPRVTAATQLLPELKIIPGFALDLTTADTDGLLWDFGSKVMRDRAMKKLKEERPLLLIGSPMCTYFSTWQRLNFSKSQGNAAVQRAYIGACMHMKFVAGLYHEQLQGGRYFPPRTSEVRVLVGA